ncbi:MAG: hypothetical protein WCX61_03430 [Candidatus Peribacteraceae bacterium]
MENILQRTQTLLSEAAIRAYEKLIEILPEALLAILIVILGWLVASIVYRICVKILNFFAVDKLVAKTPLDHMLKSLGIMKSASEILGLLVFWLTILVTLLFASEMLHLKQVSGALAMVAAYIPQVIAAFLIIVFGMLLARFLQTVIVQSLSKTEIGYERSIGRIVQVIVLVFVFLAAVEQLGLDLSFVTTNVLIVVAAILLIVGISIVVGARTVLENILACQQLKQHLSVGQKVTINGVTGKVQEFTLSSVIVETAEGRTFVPATHFFKHTYTIAK